VNNIRISIIANGFQEDYIINLVNCLVATDYKVELIGSSFYNRNKIDNRVIFSNLRGAHDSKQPFINKVLRNIKYYYKLLIHINLRCSDLIHIQWLNLDFIDGIIVPLFFRLKGIRSCYTVHDVLPHSKDNNLNRLLFFLVYRCFNQLFVHTEYIKTRLVKEFRLKPEKIVVIKHGVYEVKDNLNIDIAKARAMLNINISSFVVLFFGHITKYKGLNILLEAFSFIHHKICNYTIVIAGRVAESYRNEYEKLIEEFKFINIQALDGHIDDDMVQLLFKSANVTVLPYLEASQSGVLFMSYAYGRPVIAPRLGGFPNDIIENKTGLLFNSGDAENLAECLLNVYNRPGFSFEYSFDEIKVYALNNYSWQETGKQLHSIYNVLIK